MFDYILIALIFLMVLISFFIIQIWKKNNYVKEVYMSEGVSLAFFIIDIIITIGLIVVYFVFSKESSYSLGYLLFVLGINLIMLLFYSYTATICIYMKNDVLYKRNIFSMKQIKINKETRIVEKFDKKVVKSNENSISISALYFIGDIRKLVNNIIELINNL